MFCYFVKDEEKSELLHCFKTVTDATCWLCVGHVQLTENGKGGKGSFF